jgi:hypothetical protein
MAQEPNAILAISSVDRYIKQIGGNANQPVQNVLLAQYNNSLPDSNDFSITAPTALINGYIKKLVVSQIQLQYYIPTIVPGRNDYVVFSVETSSGSSVFQTYTTTLPYGFYAPDELAAILQQCLNLAAYGNAAGTNFQVVYTYGLIQAAQSNIGFTVVLQDNGKRFFINGPAFGGGDPNQTRQLRTYRIFGFNINNTALETTQFSQLAPDFLYTPYIDIYSDALTNYQKLKDTDTSTIRRKGLVSRIYLSGVGGPQISTEEQVMQGTFTTTGVPTGTGGTTTTTSQFNSVVISNGSQLGSKPFVLTYDLNSPKVINWTPDTAVNSLDFQLRDCYGDLLFTRVPLVGGGDGEVFNTEFQMTLLCIEDDR